MTQQLVNTGSAPNDGTGDPLRDAFVKLNANDTELYGFKGAVDAANGIISRTGAGAFSARTLAAGSAKIIVTNGDGTAGNPTIDLGTVPVASISGLGTLATQSGTFSGSHSGTSSGTNTGDQTITLTGDITGSGTASFAATIAAGAVTLAKMANMATGSLFYRKTAGSGAPEVQTLATLAADLNLSGTNTGDQTNITGNAGTATKLATARTLAITGDIAWTSPSFDGSGNVTATGTLATVNGNVGTFGSQSAIPVLTVNAKGLVTAASAVDLAGLFHPGFVSGRWYAPPGVILAGATNGANTIRLIPFLLSRAITVSAMGARVTTAAAGNCQIALYAADTATHMPTGAALASTGNLDTTTATLVSATLGSNVTLAPGLYWMAVNASATVAFQSHSTADAWAGYLIGDPSLANVSTASNTSLLTWTVSQTFGTWPNLTSASFTPVATSVGAAIFMQSA